MRVGLFIPCYVDAFFPEVGIATLEILERCGVDVSYPLDQTCCGQPMANSGCQDDAAPAEALFIENFKEFDHIIAPSGSCTHHVRSHFDAIPQAAEVKKVRSSIFELGVIALGYLAQHLVALLDPADILTNLHHAYRHPRFTTAKYAVLMTGPSATADIEGVLVRGAQGIRRLKLIPVPRGSSG